MAVNFTLLSFLWLVVACLVLVPSQAATETATARQVNSSTTSLSPIVTKTETAPLASTAPKTPSLSPSSPKPETPPLASTAPKTTSLSPSSPKPETPPLASTVSKTTSLSPTSPKTESDPLTTTPKTETVPLPTTPKTTTPSPSTSTPAPDLCETKPCGLGSSCEVRANGTFVCLCLAGDNYNYDSKICESAKVFPGQLSISGLEYNKNMDNKMSPEFKDASEKIQKDMSEVFTGSDGYSNSTVLKFEKKKPSSGSRSGDGLIATLEIIFNANSVINTEEVGKKIVEFGKVCDKCVLASADFSETDLCEKKPCDSNTTKCNAENGSFNCTCLEDYIMTPFSSRICMACPSGKKAQDSLKCVACPFGYSGFNCNESWQLWLVIVGSVLGGLLLITLILLPVVACKGSKSSKKNKTADNEKPYVSHSPAKAPLINGNRSLTNSAAPSLNGSAVVGMPKIPRATTDSLERTSLEMVPNSSRQNGIPVGRNSRLYDDRDDTNSYAQSRPQSNLYAQPQESLYAQDRLQMNPYAQSRPQINPYAQSRPQINPYTQNQSQNNPYAQSRAQVNPYAQGQGRSNLGYVHDDGRRFN